MAFKKRRMMLIPEVNPKSFVFFYEKGNSGTSWSIRDYSIRNRVKQYGQHDFHWTADDIHQKARHSLDAPTISTDNLAFWYEHTCECNQKYLGVAPAANPQQNGPRRQGSATPGKTSAPLTVPGRSTD
jgi:hypothetical protein